jgi:hypothetical protein
MRRLAALTLNQRLALLACVLGVIALAARPYGGTSVRIDARELALIVKNEVDHVTAPELADWIVQGRADYRLVDVRGEKEYEAYHIPGAERIGIDALPDAAIGRNEKIVLYSGRGIHAAQAWFLLKARGFRGVYTLRDGLEGWKDQVLFPTLTANPGPGETTRNAHLAAISARFGGTPQNAGAGGPGKALAMPKVEVPAASGATAKKPATKKEGC